MTDTDEMVKNDIPRAVKCVVVGGKCLHMYLSITVNWISFKCH